MYRRRITMTACLPLFLILMWTGTVSAEHHVGPADMVLETDKHKKTAQFPHRRHQEALQDCGLCHHAVSEDGKQAPYVVNMEIKKCAACHNKTSGVVTKKLLQGFKEAAHAKCKGCHKKRRKEGLKAGPIKCTGCHIKKK
jgi:hypothetical protein